MINPAGLLLRGAPSRAAEVPHWRRLEPTSYDTSPTPPGQEARVATPLDTALHQSSGEFACSFWILKCPQDPPQTLIVFEFEPFWGRRNVGQRGPVIWGVWHLANEVTRQLPLANGIHSFKGGRPPVSLWAGSTRADGEPGLRSRSFSIDHLPKPNSWHVRARSPFATVDVTATDPVPGSHYTAPLAAHGSAPTTMDAVLNSELTGHVTFNGRRFDIDKWRGQYWRMDIPSLLKSQFNPLSSWQGWEWNNVMEPDGGASQYYGIIDPQGQYSGVLVDARPSETRVCSKTILEFGDYEYGNSAWGDISPPFAKYTIPSWIKVMSAPGEAVQMEKTFYPDSRDYMDCVLWAATEMPMHTVPGSFGTYEHVRFMTYRLGQHRALKVINRDSPRGPSSSERPRRRTPRETPAADRSRSA